MDARKETEVTKSVCWKTHRLSALDMCHRRTVLSIEEVSKKLFLLQLRSSTSAVCPVKVRMGTGSKTGTSALAECEQCLDLFEVFDAGAAASRARYSS